MGYVVGRRTYQHIEDGLWFRPGPDHKNICCDCGSCHRINLRLRNGQIEIQFLRDRRVTAAARRAFHFQSDKDQD
jgi:hypothetical protein